MILLQAKHNVGGKSRERCYRQDSNSTVDFVKPSDAQRELCVVEAGEKGKILEVFAASVTHKRP